jgi:transcriptional regulator with XRE-family HTH domain
MDGIQLGRKLKEARLSRKLTQSDVVGTFITRNMLSQIESGAASPSLKTLEYLSNTLEIPMHYLISHESKVPDYNNLLLECKESYIRGGYTYVIDRAAGLNDKNSPYYDEGVALLARACFKRAEWLAQKGETELAAAHARLAAEYSVLGIYAGREIHADALLMIDRLSKIGV